MCRTVLAEVDAPTNPVQDLYDHYYDRARFEISPPVRTSLKQLARSFESFRETGRWLDIGFGEGAILKIAEENGWKCYGTDIAPVALAYGASRGWIVGRDAENDPRFPHRGFDIVTMIELLEHIPAPDRALRSAARLLRPGGLLYITTPNAKSLNRRMLGLEWSIFRPPEHITIWSACGLRAALDRAGFEIRRIRTEGLNPYEILARWRSRDGIVEPVDRNQAAFALNRAFSTSPPRRILKTVINRSLSIFGIGDTLKIRAIRRAAGESED